jgi:glycosyltransferase involved in cell wall biosynthesis
VTERVSARPTVSIVIPVFNAGDVLREALDGATGQTHPGVEVVVVDDGSTDATTRDILETAGRHARVRVLRKENGGPARARNVGVEQARGEYILPLDADDRVEPSFVERTLPVLESNPDVGVVHTWVGLFGRHHGTWKTGPLALPDILTRCTIHVSSLFRRRLWSDVGGWDPQFVETMEDWDFWLSAVEHGWTGRCVPEVLTYYRRLASGREVRARTPGVKARLVRQLVAKHRALYEPHVADAMAGMYERQETMGAMLERIYHTPPVRLYVRLRERWWRSRSPR